MRPLAAITGAMLAGMTATTGSAAAREATASATCQAGLDRTLAVMESIPLMKEEQATGLMWLRLDAKVALERGDAATCLRKLAAVESILGLGEAYGASRD